MLASCSLSPENKANYLIKKSMKMSLYQADTYDPVSTQLDSAFTPFDDPAFYNKTLKIYKLLKNIQRYEWKMKSAQSTMSIYDITEPQAYLPYSSHTKNQYREAKKEYDELAAKKAKAESKVKQYAAELKAAMEKKPQFIGFKATHSYRANNNAGQTMFGQMVFLFDKDISQVVEMYNGDESDYKAVQLLHKYMRGEDILTEEESTPSLEGLDL